MIKSPDIRKSDYGKPSMEVEPIELAPPKGRDGINKLLQAEGRCRKRKWDRVAPEGDPKTRGIAPSCPLKV